MKMIIIFVLMSLSTTLWSMGTDHVYKMGTEEFEGFYINKGKSSPLVFLVHDWDGIDGYEKKRSEMLAKLGYSIFAIDMFGKGVRPEKIEERKKLTGMLYKDRKRMRKLMNTGLEEAKKLGLNTSNATVVGYCFGGTSILEWAKSGVNLKGFISFHGGLKPAKDETYKLAKSKLLILHGTADQAVSMQDFADLASLLEREKVPHEMITYSGAPHAFTKFGSDRYREDADKKSWVRFTAFLKEQL